MVSELMRIMIFKIFILLDRLGILMICTHDLIVLTKTKETIRYCESFGYGGKTLSTHISIVLTQVSLPAEDIKHALKGSNTFVPTHTPSGPALAFSIMPIMDQCFRAHSSPTNYSQTTKIFINNKGTFASLIVLLKPQTTKEGHQQQNKLNTLKTTTYFSCNM
jgi:hypothetical protein